MFTLQAMRSALIDRLNLDSFSGLVVETYTCFISEYARNIARSIYTGQLTVS